MESFITAHLRLPAMRSIRLIFILHCVAFTLNFFVWNLFVPLVKPLQTTYLLSAFASALLLATPYLSGALLRLPMNMLAEKFGDNRVLSLQLLFTALPLYWLATADSYLELLAIAFLLGVCGATFNVGIRYITRYMHINKQNKAVAIYSAGLIGFAMNLVLVPVVLNVFSWKLSMTALSGVLVLSGIAFYFIALLRHLPPSKAQYMPSLGERVRYLSQLRVWRFALYYFYVFGCFMAMAAWLPFMYHSIYKLPWAEACAYTLFFVVPNIIGRISGNSIGEKYGATTINWSVFWVCMVCLFFLSFPPTSVIIHGVEQDLHLRIGLNVAIFSALLICMGFAMGVGTTSIYLLVARYYPGDRDGVSGLIASLGALGGFALPPLFAVLLDLTSIASSSFMALYLILGSCMIWMYYAIKRDAFDRRVKQAIDSRFLHQGQNPYK